MIYLRKRHAIPTHYSLGLIRPQFIVWVLRKWNFDRSARGRPITTVHIQLNTPASFGSGSEDPAAYSVCVCIRTLLVT